MKINELIPILIKIKELALELGTLVDAVTGSLENNEVKNVEAEPKVETAVEEPKKEVTLVEVRTLLATLSKDGYTNEVKELLKKYGSNKLSGIKPEDYVAILADAEELKNGK